VVKNLQQASHVQSKLIQAYDKKLRFRQSLNILDERKTDGELLFVFVLLHVYVSVVTSHITQRLALPRTSETLIRIADDGQRRIHRSIAALPFSASNPGQRWFYFRIQPPRGTRGLTQSYRRRHPNSVSLWYSQVVRFYLFNLRVLEFQSRHVRSPDDACLLCSSTQTWPAIRRPPPASVSDVSKLAAPPVQLRSVLRAFLTALHAS
jgi:hypothetical protein